MDGHTTDPSTSDPQSVLQELIMHAQAANTPAPPLVHTQHGSASSNDHHHENDYDNDNDNDESNNYEQASVSPQVEQSHIEAPLLSASVDQPHDLLSYDQISAIIASSTADRRELTTLLCQKKLLTIAQKRNVAHSHALEKFSNLLSKTRDELKSALHSLDVADIVDAEDQSLEAIRTNRFAEDAAAICPIPAVMVQNIPLLRLQSIERAEYDNALGSRLWIEAEDQQLRNAVKAAALKSHTFVLSTNPNFSGDALAEAAKLDDESALLLAEQIERDQLPSGSGRNATRGLDWSTIAPRVPSRTLDEIRTRWNGFLRPSVNSKAWSKKEIEDVIRLATPHLSAYLNKARDQDSTLANSAENPCSSTTITTTPMAPIPWQLIAQELGTARTPYACFVAFCTAIVQRDQPDMSSAEDEQIKELFSLFRGAWRFIALYNNSSPNLSISSYLSPLASTSEQNVADDRRVTILGRVGRDSSTVYRRFRNTTDPALAMGMWSVQEDLILIQAVRSLGRENWSGVAARVPNRTSSQCRERYNRRLKRFEDEFEVGDDEFDVDRIAELLGNQTKMKWSPEMDKVLVSYLDDDMKGKDGRSFASIATELCEKLDMRLSDKRVRDRCVTLRKNKMKHAKGKEKQGENQHHDHDAGGPSTRQLQPDSGSVAAENAQQLSNDADQVFVSKDANRTRTAIVPGAKRRKV
ncbi:uncharacterized protein MEPE_04661 [Melanopsichium pennsylvanicum]|uniref:Uncharacterized protein n=2 Tax=Melanopsichium pennsylvanicum TaxID=63383 RepID=A0AAJ5C6K8_9BASI|nr:putative protein [Melanopsichium pennsylvanicum 4]SNX85952.1 uncharacterized protein MEPE_04661 [Melanopsichium pennsylvanicum]